MSEQLYGLAEKIEEPMLAPDEFVKLAESIRDKWHKDRLDGARIAYIVRPGRSTVGGKTILAKAARVSGVNALLAEKDFTITIYWETWQTLDDKTRTAVLDHEFEHCDVKQDAEGDAGGWRIRPHDFDGFEAVIKRHGLYTSDLAMTGPTVHRLQQMLFDSVQKQREDRKLAKGARDAAKESPQPAMAAAS